MTRQDLEARLQALGYHVEPSSLDDIHAVLPHLEAMKERVRRRFQQSDEPAHLFRALESER